MTIDEAKLLRVGDTVRVNSRRPRIGYVVGVDTPRWPNEIVLRVDTHVIEHFDMRDERLTKVVQS